MIPPDAHVMIIGAMKSGTTSLYDHIAMHPRVCPCRTKEPEFFTRAQDHRLDADDYGGLWDFRPDVHTYVLEGSTGYTKYPMEKEVPERIREYGIRPKFIYIMRDPLSRIESHYNSGRNNPNWKRSILDDHLVNVSRYHMQLSRFTRLFPGEDFLLLDFDTLVRSSVEVLRSVCSFLQLEVPLSMGALEKRNVTPTPTVIEKLYRRLLVSRGLNRLLPDSLKRAGKRLNSRSSPVEKRQLTEEERKILQDALREDMIALNEDFGFDVSRWGF